MAPNNIKLLAKMQEVGMNAALVKFGGIERALKPGERDLLTRWSEECARRSIAFLPVFNLFGGHEPAWVTGFVKYVGPPGVEYPRTPCFADEAFWARTITPRFLAIAEALRGKNLGGICLDVEMYGADFCCFHQPCYCDACLAQFLKSKGQAADALPGLADRVKSLT